jgi:endoglucanase
MLGVLAVALVVAGCTPNEPATELSNSATASALPSETAPDRPATDVQPWTDYGDFVVDSNKAVVPAYNLSTEDRWEDYDLLMRIAGTAQARWVGSWENDTRVAGLAREVYQSAGETGRIGLVAYQGMRDYPCERAAGDPSLEEAYAARTEALVADLPGTGAQAWIIVEPALLPTLDTCAGDPRSAWLGAAVETITAAGAVVYLDATGLVDVEPAAAAVRLAALDAAGVDLQHVAGFALNSGQHRATGDVAAWGEEMLAALAAEGVNVVAPRAGTDPGEQGLGFIIDTSRNGVPLPPGQCNAAEAGLGTPPRLVGEGALDAVVWIKRPGESDGTCNEGLQIGQFALAKALELARLGVAEDPALPPRDAP